MLYRFAISLSLLLSVLFVPSLWGHSGPVHEQEMLSVFGIRPEDEKLQERMHPTIEEFRRQIDAQDRDSTHWSNLYNKLQEVLLPGKFTLGDYSHRLFFHWGFNANPRNHEPLKKQIYAASSDATKIEMAYRIIVEEQARRNRMMLLAVGRLSPAQRKHHNAVATILYDTHILGDFVEGKAGPQAAMITLNDVIEDIKKHGVMSIDCDYNLRQECCKAIDRACRSSATNEGKAKAVLNAMREQIPKCVSNSKIIKRLVWGDMTPSGAAGIQKTPTKTPPVPAK